MKIIYEVLFKSEEHGLEQSVYFAEKELAKTFCAEIRKKMKDANFDFALVQLFAQELVESEKELIEFLTNNE